MRLQTRYTFSITATFIALLTALPISASALSIANFAVTTTGVNWDADMDAAVQAELGPDYRMADWNDIVLYFQEGNDMSALTSLIGSSRYWVSLNGADIYSGNRHYFVNFSNHSTPSGFLVHAHIDNHLIDLGSWFNPRATLAFTAVPEPTTAALLSIGIAGLGLRSRSQGWRLASQPPR